MWRLSWHYLPPCLFLLDLNFQAISSSPYNSSSRSIKLCSPEQSSALLHFKSTLKIHSYSSYPCEEYYYPKTDSWKEGSDCCTWDGVTCDSYIGHGISLDLSLSGIRGTVNDNSSLFLLHNLQKLKFDRNDFNESTISSKFGKFTKLIYLNRSFSGFHGVVPTEIFHLSKLVLLDLSNGIFPLRLPELSQHVFNKHLQNLTKLRYLHLDDVDLSSVAPGSLLNLSSTMISLSVGSTRLQGRFPNGVFHLPFLQKLSLIGNGNLRGQLPDTMSNLLYLNVLNLSFANFFGKLPDKIGNLRYLNVLGLQGSKFAGHIPPLLENLTSLESLDLSFNKLVGEIPNQLASLTFLSVLNLSYNRFVGYIPQGNQFDTFQNDSYIGNLEFCGSPLSKKCGNDSEAQNHSKNEENPSKKKKLVTSSAALNKISPRIHHYPKFHFYRLPKNKISDTRTHVKPINKVTAELGHEKNEVLDSNLEKVKILMKGGVVLGALVCGVFVFGCKRVFAVESAVNAGYGVIGQSILLLKNAWPKVSQVLRVFKEQGLVLAALLGLSAFFSMVETSITTLWPWKVDELAEKEPDNGVFKMLRSDVTRFLTTILIGTTVANVGATALVTEAATALFGEAGVSAATGVMTVAVLLLTEITPKSIAVHNATEVARFVVRLVAWLSLVLYPVGRVVAYLSMGMLKALGLNGRSEPYVTEDELKLMLRGAELSGAIEEEEQVMKLMNYNFPIFSRFDVKYNHIMDLLDYVQKGDLLESTIVGDMAYKPAYFVPDSMSVWNLLREFRIRKVHMAFVLNEYGGTVGVVTLEDVVEEIVGEIFDENDSKEEIQKKTGYIVMRAEGIYDVDANTCIDQLSEDLNIKMPEGHQYEMVSGFICEAFGYIPRTRESVKVVLEKENQKENEEHYESGSDRQELKEKHLIYKLEGAATSIRHHQGNFHMFVLSIESPVACRIVEGGTSSKGEKAKTRDTWKKIIVLTSF
ncbi:uncharacterized protein LOC116134697 [Pistacia vera]|uniref:uncharacterized protein LOC116134697 n=1 Tax=Pistacia vera TaxID=55513 RepID=UPI001263E1C7|nr:uncharacterized protein LOC116134697 [Pistacia vera]